MTTKTINAHFHRALRTLSSLLGLCLLPLGAAYAKNDSIENKYLKIDFIADGAGGYGSANVYARQEKDWTPVAVWKPLFFLRSETQMGEQQWMISLPAPKRSSRTMRFGQSLVDPDGVRWDLQLAVTLESDRPLARVNYEWKPAAQRNIKSLVGPNLYVGEGTVGDAKTGGLFPGLEYLSGAERSSNPRDFKPPRDDRRTPNPDKITIPLMAVTLGPQSQKPPQEADKFFCPDSLKDSPTRSDVDTTAASKFKSDVSVGLFWNPLQRWDSQHQFPSARFASPNLNESIGGKNHRLALFLPSAPDLLPENAERATNYFSIAAGQPLKLEATLVVTPGPATAVLHEWLRDRGGLPQPNAWPRTFQQELDVCRAGFLKTVWNEKAEGWSHCFQWQASDAPGLAALVWLDSQLAQDASAREQSHSRIERVTKKMLSQSGPQIFPSQNNCHVMQWEFPFYYGYLPEALAGLDGQARGLIASQEANGGWLFQPNTDKEKTLGQPGDSVLGTCANKAAWLLRYARITGDTNALAAGERALRFMENFRVPRGGQTWECPMYEPDILAAGYAIRAYHDGYRATGKQRWLHDAVYWAETGVPFIYLWSLPDRPMMLGATIPVFGSTFYTHNWLGVPVQWNGLVYSYHVFHLAEELAKTKVEKSDSPLPLALNFSPADWKRVVELITVSAEYQQFADGEKAGTYPDSISNFTVKNGAFINPEDILINVLALNGHDPDIKTARVKTAGSEFIISSGATIEKASATKSRLKFQLKSFVAQPSHSMIVGVKPREILVGGQALPQSKQPVRREPGWWWDEKANRVYLTVAHPKDAQAVEVNW